MVSDWTLAAIDDTQRALSLSAQSFIIIFFIIATDASAFLSSSFFSYLVPKVINVLTFCCLLFFLSVFVSSLTFSFHTVIDGDDDSNVSTLVESQGHNHWGPYLL